jgi:hypothetical protein
MTVRYTRQQVQLSIKKSSWSEQQKNGELSHTTHHTANKYKEQKLKQKNIYIKQ